MFASVFGTTRTNRFLRNNDNYDNHNNNYSNYIMKHQWHGVMTTYLELAPLSETSNCKGRFLNTVSIRRGLTCTLGLTNDLIDDGQPRANDPTYIANPNLYRPPSIKSLVKPRAHVRPRLIETAFKKSCPRAQSRLSEGMMFISFVWPPCMWTGDLLKLASEIRS